MRCYGSTILTSKLIDIEGKLGLLVNWGRKLNRFEIARIEKNLEENEQRTLTQEEIKRFENSSKKILAENEIICVYMLGIGIYINRVRQINPRSTRVTFQKIL